MLLIPDIPGHADLEKQAEDLEWLQSLYCAAAPSLRVASQLLSLLASKLLPEAK